MKPDDIVHGFTDELRWAVFYNDELVALFRKEKDADKWVKSVVRHYGNRLGSFHVAERRDN